MPPRQSPNAPTWATDANYPSGTDAWSSTPTRVAPAAPEAAAGVTPGGQLPAQWFNYLHGEALAQLAALVDAYALNWPETGDTESDGYVVSHTAGTLIASAKVGGLGGQFDPWLFVNPQSGVGTCYRSRDGQHWIVGNAPPSMSGQEIDLCGWGSKCVLLADAGADCLVWGSSDAAANWSGPFTLPNGGGNPNYDRVAWIQSASLYVAAGAGCLATSPDLSAWTTRATASSYGAACVAVAGEGESGVGALIPRSNSNEISYTLNGTAWFNVTVGAPGVVWVAACWSEVHGAWFALNDHGELFRAATVDGSWSQIASLYGPTLSSFTRTLGVTMTAFGKNLVILGEKIRTASTPLLRAGNVLVYDPVNQYGSAISPGAGYESSAAYDRIVHHDGRLVIARTEEGVSPYVHLAMSMRAPWEAA